MDTYEKKYKEANDKVAVRFGTNVAKEIFTDLYESADERIRKEIIVHIKWCEDNGYCAKEEMTRWIDFLKKQGEQKPAECSRVPLREMVLNVWELGNIWKELTKGSVSAEHGTQLDYIVKHWKEGEHYIKFFEKQGEQKPAWSEEDERIIKRIDSLLYSQCKIHGSEYEKIHNWLKSLKERIGG